MPNEKNQPKGQALVLIALAIVALIGVLGLAVDGSNILSSHRNAQNAADGAAMSAALVYQQNTGNWANYAKAVANRFGFNNNGTTNTVVLNNPPAAGCDGTTPSLPGTNTEYIQVVIKENVPTYFASIVGISKLKDCVSSIAHITTSTPGAPGMALVALNKTAHNAIKTTGTGGIIIQNGGIWDNSNASGDALTISNSGAITADQNIGIFNCGGTSDPNHLVSPTPQPCGAQINDPYATLAPPDQPSGTCTNINYSNSSTLTLDPGCYTGISNSGAGTIWLNPGIYYLSSQNLSNAGNGYIRGDGVMVYLKAGGFSNTGGGGMIFSPPTSGTYAGMSVFVDRANSKQVTVTGNGGTGMTGTIYAPASAVTVTGSGSNTVIDSQIIGDTIACTGGGTITISFDSSKNFNMAGSLTLYK